MMVLKSKVTEFGSVISKEEVTDYKDYYKLLECSTFDVVMVTWNYQAISLFIDDEGMMKSGNLGRLVQGYPEPLFGNIVITGGVDEEGETLPFPIEHISMLEAQDMIKEARYVIN